MLLSNCRPLVRFAGAVTLKKYPARRVVAYDYRLFYLTSGSMVVQTTTKHLLSVGSVLVLPPGVSYRILTTNAALLVLNFDCNENALLSSKPIAPVPVEEFCPQKAAALVPEDAPELGRELFEKNAAFAYEPLLKMIAEKKENLSYFSESTALRLKLLLIELLRRRVPQGASVLPCLNAVTDYIHHHLTNPLSNKELAGVAGYHPYYLNRLMQRCHGQTLHSYVTLCRLNSAAERLLYSSESMECIGRQCGFLNQAYFAACFKKQFGVTPSVYRKQNSRLL